MLEEKKFLVSRVINSLETYSDGAITYGPIQGIKQVKLNRSSGEFEKALN